MNLPTPLPAPVAAWNPAHCAAAAIATLAAIVALGNVFRLAQDIGTEAWWPGAVTICAAGAAFLVATSLDHWQRGRWISAPPRAEPWLSILILVLGWSLLARGSSSRMLLAGLGPMIAALSAAASISLLIHLRERLVLGRPAPTARGRWPLGAWRCAAAAALLLGVVYLESRPLPEIKPWESHNMAQPSQQQP